mmetsp:Transcript_19343/g.28832  ORF Transcript_19343/g.28832 Transcript_19343/m.28832 type:complete len:252 (+) Transcript_19343:40-795(+)|eukprot:CAMPEP_0201558418 /NCGR_PEP_ID=MMETSP0173_2-20130828/67744_1 /ASSEMBLY_ACC=CAM_ASM_000268 /TAXON_ID=218659 /ORGANISM="Vexillifera sp., Strain DIVA3 564/2" /LENGTH=251 /DNA_ID=CAMNT_0047971807 /DNA_START=31 /DNA_END=786 /DNA_ORIENTATION=+
MHRFFGSSKPKETQPQPSLHENAENMNSRADLLQAKIDKSNADLLQLRDRLRQTRSPAVQNQIKQRMMQIVKQKKMYMQQQDMLRTQTFNLENTAFQIESMKDNVNALNAVKGAHQEMKKQMGGMNIDDLEDLQDEIEDLFIDTQEIQEAFSRSYSVPDLDIDDVDLDAELDALDDYELSMGSTNPTTQQQQSDSILPSYLADMMPGGTSSTPVDDYGLPAVPSSQPAPTPSTQPTPTPTAQPTSNWSLGF